MHAFRVRPEPKPCCDSSSQSTRSAERERVHWTMPDDAAISIRLRHSARGSQGCEHMPSTSRRAHATRAVPAVLMVSAVGGHIKLRLRGRSCSHRITPHIIRSRPRPPVAARALQAEHSERRVAVDPPRSHPIHEMASSVYYYSAALAARHGSSQRTTSQLVAQRDALQDSKAAAPGCCDVT